MFTCLVERRVAGSLPFLHETLFSAEISFITCGVCEGDGDVVGVVTPLRGVVQVVLHGVQVVEVGVRLGCIKTEEWKKTAKVRSK